MKPKNQKEKENKLVISYLTTRRAVGILGISLPIILAIGNLVLTACKDLQPSISQYYYTRMGHYFVGVLCAVALFLFSYKGYDKRDRIGSLLASLFALGVAFFPMKLDGDLSDCKMINSASNNFIDAIHFTSATLFFLTLAYMSYFLFTKTDGHVTSQKKKRNIFYKVCAWVMVLCIAVIAAQMKVAAVQKLLEGLNLVFWLETLALWAFGISWLVKGEFILKD